MIIKGWEYLNRAETHMKMSKRHVFNNEDRPVCGASTPRPELIGSMYGDQMCKSCDKWSEKHLSFDEYFKLLHGS
jgi:hypothetical protein